jgi:hypothetical protein
MQVTYGKEFGFHRAKVDRLHAHVETLPQVDCPVRHFFAPGMFAREITIPAGVVLIGAVHKTENLAVLSKGRLLLATPAGPVEISAPYTLTVMPGDKNSATALEEAVWTNFFPNPDNEKSIDVLIEKLSESKASDLIGGSTNKQLAANRAAELEA